MTTRPADWIRLNAARTPDKRCMVTESREFTFSQVNTRVNRIANVLKDRGISRGDRVALYGTDSHRYIEAILACLKLGAVYVPLNYRLAPPEVQALLNAAEAKALFFSDRYESIVDELKVASLEHLICFETSPIADLEHEQMCADGDDAEVDTPVDDSDIVSLAFTSGTTALPKGVMHSQRLLKWFVYQSIIERHVTEDSFHYSAAPLFHVAGLSFTLMGVARGFPVLILPEFKPATAVQWLAKGEIDSCFLVPTMIDSILREPGIDAHDFSRLVTIGYGAEPMRPALLRRAMAVFDCDFMNLFGAGTEAGLQTVLSPEAHRRALRGEEHLLTSIGKPGFMVDLRICDENLNDVAQGEVGEIVTRSEAVMSGYLNMPEATAAVLVDGGWFRGGDLAYQDAEGFLYLSGRKKDVIIRGGENVYPEEIELVISSYTDVSEVAVVGVSDDHWGEVVRAHVVMRPGSVLDPEALRAYCRERLASFKVPVDFVVETAFPRNPSGKVLKRELKQRIRPG